MEGSARRRDNIIIRFAEQTREVLALVLVDNKRNHRCNHVLKEQTMILAEERATSLTIREWKLLFLFIANPSSLVNICSQIQVWKYFLDSFFVITISPCVQHDGGT